MIYIELKSLSIKAISINLRFKQKNNPFISCRI